MNNELIAYLVVCAAVAIGLFTAAMSHLEDDPDEASPPADPADDHFDVDEFLRERRIAEDVRAQRRRAVCEGRDRP